MRKTKTKELTEEQKEYAEIVKAFLEAQKKVKDEPLSTVLQKLLDLSAVDVIGTELRYTLENYYRVKLEKAIAGLTLLHE